MLQLAEVRSAEEIDALDIQILQKILERAKQPEAIEKSLNINPKDLAIHLYKLMKQNVITCTFQGGEVQLALTELGFKKISEQEKVQAPQQSEVQKQEEKPKEENKQGVQKSSIKFILMVVIVIALIFLVLYFLSGKL